MSSRARTPEQSWRLLCLLYLSLIASCFLYIFVGYKASKLPPLHDGDAPIGTLRLIFVAFAAGVTVAIPVMRRTLLGKPNVHAPSAEERAARKAIAYGTRQVATWVMCESIAVFGLMLSVISHDWHYAPIFVALAFFNFARYRPAKAERDAIGDS